MLINIRLFKKLKDRVKALSIQTDVGNEKDTIKLKKIIKVTYGSINILINNSDTIGREYSLIDMPTKGWDHLTNVDLREVFLTSKYLVPLIDSQNVGKVINISSELSLKGGANSHIIPRLRTEVIVS